MISVIFGRKGSGKTKRIIDMANAATANNKGDLVFIDDDNRYMFELHRNIRFINAGEYDISNPVGLLGFISGICASNYDLETLFLDGFLRIVKAPLEEMRDFFALLDALGTRMSVNFIISISGDPQAIPDFIAPFVI